MLDAIRQYVASLADVIATVTGVDIEVVDRNLVRVAGTGIYAAGVGQSIVEAGNLYTHSLANAEALFIDDPARNPLCAGCPNLSDCREKLTLCAPILSDGEILGIIGLVCFNETDRDKVLAHRDLYIRFVGQIADTIGRVAKSEDAARQTRRRLAMLLEITDANSRGVLVLDQYGRITFLNDHARQELGLPAGDGEGLSVSIQPTGDSYSGLEEFILGLDSVTLGRSEREVLGRLVRLEQDDPAFDRALVFDSKARLAEMVSKIGGASPAGDAFQELIGGGPAILNLKKRVRQIAGTLSTVLITGESGTGKELFARAIHAASPRRDRPFVAINCGAIPDALLESELFGYARGAFTNADPSGRMGKFELADQGVLFLDEIGSMPLHLQVKLLRVLQERAFCRLGSNHLVRVDIRVIAATNEKLPNLIAERLFREDLYYRLNVIPLEIPPLRERRRDIPELAAHFLDRYRRLFAKTASLRFSPGVLAVFDAYPWSGNIRELENCIEYMVSMQEGGEVLSEALLPAKLAAFAGSFPASPVAPPLPGPPGRRRPDKPPGLVATVPIVPLAELEMQAIRSALQHFGSDTEGKKRAAEALGIGIATLYRKLREERYG